MIPCPVLPPDHRGNRGAAPWVGPLRKWPAIVAGLLVCSLVYAKGPLPAQTDVDRAEHVVDAQGVPALKIAGVGTYHNPAGVAIYALGYAGAEVYDSSLKLGPDPDKLRACVDWLAHHLVSNREGDPVWLYRFDNSYNDITIRAPWSSAFAQATGIQALLASYRLTGEAGHLKLAQQAAQALLRPVEDGGLLFQRGKDIWFEEIPEPAANPPHILNGHMRALLALRELAEVAGDPSWQDWFRRGVETLERWLPLYDAGYWLRYDLNPKKTELLFRIANPYGLKTHALAIERIALRDPQGGGEVSIDVGSHGDAEGAARIAGIDWGQPAEVDGRTVRRLAEVEPQADPAQPTDGLSPPHTYFYFDLPGDWRDNLRTAWLELEIDYFDAAQANLSVQMRSIAPGMAFRNLRDGDLMLSGAGQWRKWVVPLRPTDLGFWVGQSYASKHTSYLRQLAESVPSLARWAQVAQGYERLGQPLSQATKIVDPPVAELPCQTPLIPIYSLDEHGVLMQHRASPISHFHNGVFDPTSGRGTPVYSPYVVANQVLSDPTYFKSRETTHLDVEPSDISSQPAIAWLLDPANSRRLGDALVYEYHFPNVYNDKYLSLSGDHQWRKRFFPLSVPDLGFWVGNAYASKYAAYLQRLAESVPALAPWAARATFYASTWESVPPDTVR